MSEQSWEKTIHEKLSVIDELTFYAHDILCGAVEFGETFRGKNGVVRRVSEVVRLPKSGETVSATIEEKGFVREPLLPDFREPLLPDFKSLVVRTSPPNTKNELRAHPGQHVVGWDIDGDPNKQWSKIGAFSSAQYGAAFEEKTWLLSVMDAVWDQRVRAAARENEEGNE